MSEGYIGLFSQSDAASMGEQGHTAEVYASDSGMSSTIAMILQVGLEVHLQLDFAQTHNDHSTRLDCGIRTRDVAISQVRGTLIKWSGTNERIVRR